MQIHEQQKGLISWYDFKKDSKILYVGESIDGICDYLREKNNRNLSVTSVSVDELEAAADASGADERSPETRPAAEDVFDYIICVENIERIQHPQKVLLLLKHRLKQTGILLLGMNNRFGIRYFCGDRDQYTGRNFDGIENYRSTSLKDQGEFCGRMYNKHEIELMLEEAGFKKSRFFSVLSNLDNPSHLLAYGHIPNEDLANRLYPAYYSPETIFLEEESLYQSLFDNNMFHQMANAYLVEACISDDTILSDALEITATMDRSRQDAMITIIHENTVEKKNAYPEGRERFYDMMEYAEDLKVHGLKVVDMNLTDSGITMPYIDAPTGQLYLKNLMKRDIKAFYEAMDRFIELVDKSSDVIEGSSEDECGTTFACGYPDIVPLNCFFIDGDFVFFDQEYRRECYAVNAIKARAVTTLYFGNSELNNIIPKDSLYKRYGLYERLAYWRRMESEFLCEIRNDGLLREYHQRVRRKADVVSFNRKRINSTMSMETRYEYIFDGDDEKECFVFGSGVFAQDFIDRFGDKLRIKKMLDNDAARWGENIKGVEIVSPDILVELTHDSFRVYICIKDAEPVIRQMDRMHVMDYRIYDRNKRYSWEGRRVYNTSKQYRVGYVAGAFDMFHIGHLNLLRRAKERCDYLIAGVMSDEKMYSLKKKYPVIPCNERMKIVEGCRYVDEVGELPVNGASIRAAYERFHFDCMFSGDDHAEDPSWLAEQAYLRERGSDIVFVPYTKETSSTAIREKMRKQ